MKDSRIEPLLLRHGKNVDSNDFITQLNLVLSFENLRRVIEIKEKEQIAQLFKVYLDNVNKDKTEENEKDEALKAEIRLRKKKLKEALFQVGAFLDIDLKGYLFDYIKSLTQSFENLPILAKVYKNDNQFIAIIIEKLENTTNSQLITNLLEAILEIQEGISNWREIILQYIKDYELNDQELIEKLGKTDLVNESLALTFLRSGLDWQLSFIRQFLINNPNKFEMWPKFKEELIILLEMFNSEQDSIFENKKRFVLRVLIDLDKRDMIKYCLKNYKYLNNDELKKTSLFAMINLGNEEIWSELRTLMEEDSESKEYITKFWKHLERCEWKFHY